MEDAWIRRWQRISELPLAGDELRELHAAVRALCEAPGDPTPRAALHVLTDTRALHDQAFPMLSVEARTQQSPAVLVALREEARRLCDHVYRPTERLSALEDIAKLEPDNPVHVERLAWMYYLVGAWVQAGQTLEQLAPFLATEKGLVALRAAGRLYRNSGRNDRALIAYRAVGVRRPSDLAALTALAELMLAPSNIPDSPFDPQPPQAQPPANVTTRSGTTQTRGSPIAPANQLALTNRQAAADLHDLFASLADDEIEGSLAFAFGDDHQPEPSIPETPPTRSARQTRERDGVLRPPAPPSKPIELPRSDGSDTFTLDELIDAEKAAHGHRPI